MTRLYPKFASVLALTAALLGPATAASAKSLDLPVTISFFGTAFSEAKFFALGYSFEQATHAIRRPVNTPALPGAVIELVERSAN